MPKHIIVWSHIDQKQHNAELSNELIKVIDLWQ